MDFLKKLHNVTSRILTFSHMSIKGFHRHLPQDDCPRVSKDIFVSINNVNRTILGHTEFSRSLSRATSLNQHSSHFGEISASMIFNHLSVADIKSSSPHLNTLHIQILFKNVISCHL